MQRIHLVTAATVATIVLGGCAAAERDDASGLADAYDFTDVVFPGATATMASGINAGGHVVGWYMQEGRTHGFVLRDGKYTAVDHPGAEHTYLHGIAGNGDIAGSYRRKDDTAKFAGQPVAARGFVLRASGEFVPVNHPGRKHTVAQRILDDGTIVGCFHDDDWTTSMRGITVRAGGTDTVAVAATMSNGATPDGRTVVGMVMDGRGYVVEDGKFRYFDAPGSKSTEAWDINASGTIVGVMVDSSDATRGFVHAGGKFVPLEAPRARSTVAFGINARGDVVGAYRDSTDQGRGFVARRRQPAR